MDKNKVDYGPMEFATRAIKYGEGPDPVTHALNTPIYETTTYAYNETDEYDRMIGDAMAWKPGCRIYSRTTNPTTQRQMNLSWGVVPLMADEKKSMDDLFDHAVERAVKAGYLTMSSALTIRSCAPPACLRTFFPPRASRPTGWRSWTWRTSRRP